MDVRIVGGGLAGIVTGIQLLRRDPDAGHRVTVYERRPQVTTTLCGEGLSATTLGRMDWPGFDHGPFLSGTFRGAAWYLSNGKHVTLPDTCHTIDRARWIPAMADHFESLGGVVRTGESLREGDIRALPGDLVVGADGPGSKVRRIVGGSMETRLGIQYRVTEPEYENGRPDRLVFVTDKRYSPEYSWVFPRGDVENIGLLAAEDGADWDRLDRFMAAWGVRGTRARREAYPIAFNGDKVQEGRYVLIGDAAGLTNPVTKGGMAAIVYASEILADVVREGRIGEYGERIFRHPITDPSFQKALRVITSSSNERLTRWTRFMPMRFEIGERGPGVNWPLVLRTGAGNLGALRSFYHLYRALALSRVYSW